ncbi:MAG: NADH-quinone oxidoreductase subunit J [Planctomycetota bacterium]
MSMDSAVLLYLVFAAGGAGLYFLMPKAERPSSAVGVMFGVASLVGLFAFLISDGLGPRATGAYFCFFGGTALAAATRVITHVKPVYSALYFVLVVVAVAALLVLQEAEFLAVALIIVYAGAILVTYLFVIMLAQPAGSPVYDRRAREPFAAILACFALTGAIAGGLPSAVGRPSVESRVAAASQAEPSAGIGNTEAIGGQVMTRYVVVLQLAGVLLLISMVGAIALSRKRVPSEMLTSSRPALGQVGKEAVPF